MLRPFKNALYTDADRIKPLKVNDSVHSRPGKMHKETGLKTIKPGQEFSCQPFGSSCTCDMCSRLNRMPSLLERLIRPLIEDTNRQKHGGIDMTRTLKNLAPGDKACIKSVSGNGSIRRRLLEMGLVPGVELTMERYAPLGDPVEIKSQGFHLSLRKGEADTIFLESIDGGE